METLRDVETEESVDTLVDRLAEVKVEKVGGTLRYAKDASLV